MDTKKGLIATFLSMAFLAANVTPVGDAEAAQKRHGATKSHHMKKRTPPGNQHMMRLGGEVPDVSSVVVVIDENNPKGFRIVSPVHEILLIPAVRCH